MDTLEKKLDHYRALIEKILTEIAAVPYAYGEVQDKTIFDRKTDSYAVFSEGFDKHGRVHHFVVHLEIINGKIWVQADNTDLNVTQELEEAGVPKSDIVIGFHPPHIRSRMDYAAA